MKSSVIEHTKVTQGWHCSRFFVHLCYRLNNVFWQVVISLSFFFYIYSFTKISYILLCYSDDQKSTLTAP